MAKTIRCADFDTDCTATFTTEDTDELMQHVQTHVESAHHMTWSPELAEVAKTRSTDS